MAEPAAPVSKRFSAARGSWTCWSASRCHEFANSSVFVDCLLCRAAVPASRERRAAHGRIVSSIVWSASDGADAEGGWQSLKLEIQMQILEIVQAIQSRFRPNVDEPIEKVDTAQCKIVISN
jgi:hypothetical protein